MIEPVDAQRREREAALARAKHLDQLAGKEPVLWEKAAITRDGRDVSKHVENQSFRRRSALVRSGTPDQGHAHVEAGSQRSGHPLQRLQGRVRVRMFELRDRLLEHAGYYPGAAQLHIKLVTEQRTGKLLGAQIVGGHGVDKRIDVLATALHAGLNVSDLEDLDLAYAPQFSSAKDPVVMAGFVAANAIRGEAPSVTWKALEAAWPKDLQLIDVRTPKEFETGAVMGAVNIPIDDLRGRLRELDPRKETVAYCRVGFRGYLATTLLRQHGFEHVRNLSGGILSTPERAREGLAVVPPSAPKVIHLGDGRVAHGA